MEKRFSKYKLNFLDKFSSKIIKQQLLLWLLKKEQSDSTKSIYPWWQVMCLTGVDYFSTLGYQPGIAALVAGDLAPIATIILVLLTLFGALPIYKRVAMRSPHGQGSIAILEKLLSWWQGKLLVLCLLGFVATDFIITITLSASDATAHIVENPWISPLVHGHNVLVALLLIALLGGVFFRGFQEAIKISVFLVVVYLLLNGITIAVAFAHIFQQPELIIHWETALFTHHSNPLMMVVIACLIFPKIALGLSGFETGVVVMPLVEGSRYDTPNNPRGRIRNTYKLLQTAAIIMSGFLITSSFVTTWLIAPEVLAPGGAANGRAIAYLAYLYLGNIFGTIYDLSTIAILWFAGASAMAGLLNIVPRYLPRYGMAPEWARKRRPLIIIYLVIAFGVIILFQASVDAQGGAYATGVLVLMSSSAFAVTLLAQQSLLKKSRWFFGIITLVFVYATVVNIIERPDGVKIATFFITAIIISSLISRIVRSTEIRAESILFDKLAQDFINQNLKPTRIIAHRRDKGNVQEYILKEQSTRKVHNLPPAETILFLEVDISDPSDFREIIYVTGVEVAGYKILRVRSDAVPNAIAALLLEIRNQTSTLPHAYFGWPEGNPLVYLMRFLLFGEGDIAVITREVLRRTEKNPQHRPIIHVGG